MNHRFLALILLLLTGLLNLMLGCSLQSTTPPPVTPIATARPTRTHTPLPTVTPPPPPLSTPLPQPATAISAKNAEQLTPLAYLGLGSVIRHSAWSPDGRLLAVAANHKLYLYETETLATVNILETAAERVSGLTFSPDSQILAASSGPAGTIQLWQVDTGALLLTLPNGNANEGLLFSPDGSVLAARGRYREGTLLWRVDDGSLLYTLPKGYVISMVFSPDGQTLALGFDDGVIQVWQFVAGNLSHHTLQGGEGWVYSLDFSPNGQHLAAGMGDGNVQLWSVADWSLQTSWPPSLTYHGRVRSVIFSPDSGLLAVGHDSDTVIRLWRVADGALLHTLPHIGGVTSVVFSPDGQTLASGTFSHRVRLWRVADGTLLHKLEGHTDIIYRVAFSPDGLLLASSSADVRLWRVADGASLSPNGHTEAVSRVAFDRQGQTLSSGHCYYSRLWRMADGALLYPRFKPTDFGVFPPRPDNICHRYGIVSHPANDRGMVEAAQDHYKTYYFDKINLRQIAQANYGQDHDGPDSYTMLWPTLEKHNGYLTSLALSPDGQFVAIGSTDQSVRLWQTDDGTLLETLVGHTAEVKHMTFSPDGQFVASAAADNTVRLWRVEDKALLYTLEGHSAQVNSITFASDGQMGASASDDNTVGVWQRVADDIILQHTLSGHDDAVLSVAFSPDGQLIASGSRDHTIRLWQSSDGLLLTTLAGYSAVNSLAFSPDGTILAAGLEQGRVQLWGVVPSEIH